MELTEYYCIEIVAALLAALWEPLHHLGPHSTENFSHPSPLSALAHLVNFQLLPLCSPCGTFDYSAVLQVKQRLDKRYTSMLIYY